MSVFKDVTPRAAAPHEQQRVTESSHFPLPSGSFYIQDVLTQVQSQITPVWPLRDYVAVNPFAGLADRKFLSARSSLRAVSDFELLMPVDYYRQQFEQGAFCKAHIDEAVDELVADGAAGSERIDVNQVVAFLREQPNPSPTADAKFTKTSNPSRLLRAFTETLDCHTGSNWCRVVLEEISKHCAAHYDQGQALWPSPWQRLSLYEAWRSAAEHDLSFEILGVGGFRKFVSRLPDQPHAAVVVLLNQLGVPSKLWSDFLLCESLAMPGWSAWAKYQFRESERRGEESTDFAGLLAIRLAYEVALSIHFDFRIDWTSVAEGYAEHVSQSQQRQDEALLRYALLKASEIAFRKQLVANLAQARNASHPDRRSRRRLAQMVFCIDVRSERIRRHLEATSGTIETFGFAGFFGLPMEFVGLGETDRSSQVPVLVSPRFCVHEEVADRDATITEAACQRRGTIRFLRKAWKDFQASAISSFAFVETTGIFYGFQLVARSIGLKELWPGRFDGVGKADRQRLAPSLRGLSQEGCGTSQQADLAESILRGIGLVADFARLVVFCGHRSQTENNPLQAGLDCGACGGHSGEANARLVAKLLNQKHVREALAARGVEIPEDTQFVGALHNTTTDEIDFFDTYEVPHSHRRDLEKLSTFTRAATTQTSSERLSVLPGRDTYDLVRRSGDWSEVRPEWGLAGNAVFLAAPRSLTESVSLGARAFLHSYDYRNDPDFTVLEQIMTAPLVVANWINMQYYASTVDPIHFGSGNKTVHNVVGRFGIFSGNGGDLMTGLPWQSIHDGENYQHHPLRLLAFLAAPREAIETVLGKHSNVAALLTNGWLQLVAIDGGDYYRYTEQQSWEEIATDAY